MRMARPLSSVSMKAPHTVAGPSAGARRSPGILRMNRAVRRLFRHADDAVVIAAHAEIGRERGAAGRIWWSAVGTWVCVPTMAETLPSKAWPNAHFLGRRLGMEIDEGGMDRCCRGDGG